jgi:hypothetical protein
MSIFRHRHGTWRDLGNFLKFIFQDVPSTGVGETPSLKVIGCRHNPGGREYPTLMAGRDSPVHYPMFDPEIHYQPCVTLGSFDEGKNPGLVVSDLCSKAKDYLASIGKGNGPDDRRGRDYEYVPPSGPSTPSLEAGSSVVTESLGALFLPEEEDILIGTTDLPETTDGYKDSSSYYDGDSIWGEDDADLGFVLSPHDDESQQTVATLSDAETIDSATPRRSTKMRVATLAYLWKFADQPTLLKEAFQLLIRDRELQVLHLCGCGICRTEQGSAQKTQIPGCVQPAHLILGSAVMNGHHKNFHITLALCQPSDYADLCAIFHKTESGVGIF